MSKLLIEDLRVTYGPIVGTDGVTLRLDQGETVALIGANGAGKSSTLKAIMGMAHYAPGRILLDGADLKDLKPSLVVRRGVGYSPEGRRVFPDLSVLDNLRVGGISRPQGELAARIDQIYGYFPRLGERAKQRAGSLSGGEQQMLAISRALMSRPKLALFDEPSLGLAPNLVERTFEIIKEIRRQGTTVVMVEQNAFAALELSDRAYVLEQGRVALTGTGADLLDNPHVKSAYLGA